MSSKNKSSRPPHSTWQPARVVVSILILLHFSLIVATYAANWRRTAWEDAILVAAQPYLIPGNWYYEMLPIEWISDKTSMRPTEFAVQTSSDSNWKTILQGGSKSLAQSKAKRLLSTVAELAVNENEDGLNLILHSMVEHFERQSNEGPSKESVQRIRLVQWAEEEAQASNNESSESMLTLYEGDVVRFADGSFGFIPVLEPLRSVPPRSREPQP